MLISDICVQFLQSPSPSGKASPEQRSFRDRQKYFEIDVKQQTPEKPKPRVSLVGEDDLKKMREEEGLFCREHLLLITCENISQLTCPLNLFILHQRGSLSSERGSICWMKMMRMMRRTWPSR